MPTISQHDSSDASAANYGLATNKNGIPPSLQLLASTIQQAQQAAQVQVIAQLSVLPGWFQGHIWTNSCTPEWGAWWVKQALWLPQV